MTGKIAKNKQASSGEPVETVLKLAKRKGVKAAEVSLSIDVGVSVSVRKGEVETVEHQHDKRLSVTIYRNGCKGSVSTSDLSDKALRQVVEKAGDIAKYTARDEFAGIPEENAMAWEYPDLALAFQWDISIDDQILTAKECEDVALTYNRKIVNSEGATVSTRRSFYAYGNSHGFVGSYPSSRHSISCSVIGKDKTGMQRDYWYSSSRDPHLLESAEQVGKTAAKRTLARLNARKIATTKRPVIFSPEVASGLLGHFVSAISGSSLYRKSSFLLDAMGQEIFPSWLYLYQQPHIIGGPGSAPFDSEGVATQSRSLVEAGRLSGYLLDSYAGRKLNLFTTGNAGGVFNLMLAAGRKTFNELVKEMHTGLVVTELMGQGINLVTGDYSRGAAGFWVENGKIQYPVEEITVAGNLKDMFKKIVAVGSDLDERRNIQTGSIMLEEMMIAGS